MSPAADEPAVPNDATPGAGLTGPVPSPTSPIPAAAGHSRAHAWAVGVLVASALVAVVITWAVVRDGSQVLAIDESLTGWTRSWADSWGWPVTVAWLVGILAGPLLATIYAVVAVRGIASTGFRAAAVLLALSSLLGVLLAEVLKRTVARQRPPGAEEYESGMLRSFPSGHSMAGIYLYLLSGVLFVLLGRALGRRGVVGLGWALVLCGPLIGASRLVLGVHWPSDIVGGWAYGSVAALSCSLLLWESVARCWQAPTAGRTSTTASAPGEAQDGTEGGATRSG